jgi:DNA-binding GntR family transcriptional regulator
MAKKNTSINDEKKSLVQEVTEKIRSAILEGKLKPRERLIAASLASDFKMSRTPIREALQQLKLKGYVNTMPTGRMVVADLSKKEIIDIFEIREALERKAIFIACKNIKNTDYIVLKRLLNKMENSINNKDYRLFVETNSRFHSYIYSLTGNKNISSLIEDYRDQVMDVRLAHTFGPEDWNEINLDHKRILEALESKNCKKVQSLISQHLSRSLKKRIERL